jgi:hypothetical protein
VEAHWSVTLEPASSHTLKLKHLNYQEHIRDAHRRGSSLAMVLGTAKSTDMFSGSLHEHYGISSTTYLRFAQYARKFQDRLQKFARRLFPAERFFATHAAVFSPGNQRVEYPASHEILVRYSRLRLNASVTVYGEYGEHCVDWVHKGLVISGMQRLEILAPE